MTYSEYNQSDRYAVLAELYLTPAPIYLMTEPLVSYVDTDSPVMFMWVQNSSSSGATYNGKLYQANGVDPYYPLIGDYPQDGTINLYDGNYIDTKWIAPPDEIWSMAFIDQFVSSTEYRKVIMNYNGDLTMDVWYGDAQNEPTLLLENTGLDYTPPLDSFKISDSMDIPVPVAAITHKMGVVYENIDIIASNGEHVSLIEPNVLSSMVDTDGVDNGMTLLFAPTGGAGNGTPEEGVTGFLLAEQMDRFFWSSDGVINWTIAGVNQAKTYTLRVSGTTNLSGDRATTITHNAVGKEFYAYTTAGGANINDGVEFAGIVPVAGEITFTSEVTVGTLGMISGFDLIEEA